MSEVRGETGRGRPPFRWMDGVRKACAGRGMELEEAKGVCMSKRFFNPFYDAVTFDTS